MIRHAHLPWRIFRQQDHTGRWVAWQLHTRSCPHCPCPECGGAVGWWADGDPFGDDPDYYPPCVRCMEPLAVIRIPARLDRLLPRSPARLIPWTGGPAQDDDPPF